MKLIKEFSARTARRKASQKKTVIWKLNFIFDLIRTRIQFNRKLILTTFMLSEHIFFFVNIHKNFSPKKSNYAKTEKKMRSKIPPFFFMFMLNENIKFSAAIEQLCTMNNFSPHLAESVSASNTFLNTLVSSYVCSVSNLDVLLSVYV